MPDKTAVIINASEARQRFGQLIKRAYRGDEHIIVQKGGIPIVAIISLPEYEEFRRLLALRHLEEMNRTLSQEAKARGISEKKLLEISEEAKKEVYREVYGESS